MDELNGVDPTHDDKGRVLAHKLTDRELLIEIAENQRATADMVTEFVTAMQGNKMLSMFAGKLGK